MLTTGFDGGNSTKSAPRDRLEHAGCGAGLRRADGLDLARGNRGVQPDPPFLEVQLLLAPVQFDGHVRRARGRRTSAAA